MHNLAFYVKEEWDLSLENSTDSHLCLELALLHSVSYFLFLHWSPSPSFCTVSDAISSNIDEVFLINSSANVFAFWDFIFTIRLTYIDETDRPAWYPPWCQPLIQRVPTPPDKKHHVPPPPPLFLQFSGTEVPIPWFIESPLCFNEALHQYNFLGICEIFNITNSIYKSGLPYVISVRNNEFRLFNFVVHNYPFFSSHEIAVGKNVSSN